MINKTLVIIPGWGGNHETWEKFIEKAKPYFQDVVCIDLPCFGGVECPKEVWGVEEYATYLEKEIEKLHADHIILLGHSFGGQVATFMLANYPEMAEKFILSAGAVFRPKRKIRRAFFWFIAKFGKMLFRLPVIENVAQWARKVLYKAADSPDYSKTSGVQKEIFQKIIRQDLSELLPHFLTPTLILWGTKDKYLPVSDAYKAHKKIKNSQLKIFHGAGHGLHIQQTEEMVKVICKFVET